MPFNRADYVLDLMPFETRGKGQGPGREKFGPDTWIRLDACRDPLPFEEKSSKFAVCSHILKDTRDSLLCTSTRPRDVGNRDRQARAGPRSAETS
jgi:hypothetical protein